jgi:hypothetical protein
MSRYAITSVALISFVNFRTWPLAKKNSLRIEQKVYMEKKHKSCHIFRGKKKLEMVRS